MTTLRAIGILALFVLVTVILLPVQWLALKLRRQSSRTIPHRYHRFICRLFGVRILVRGTPQRGGVLLTVNHSGWLDIPILSAVGPVSFISKHEVRKWPFFGTLAELQRTIFTRRERSAALQERDVIRKRLRDGDTLVIFPEGTSSDGNRVLTFRSALLSAADLPLEDDGAERALYVPVQPVSIAYTGLHGIPMGRENRPFFAWYGDMELVPHLWAALKRGPIDVSVEFHQPLTLDAVGGRKKLAMRCETAVRAGLIRALSGASAPVEAAQHDEALLEALHDAEKETEEVA